MACRIASNRTLPKGALHVMTLLCESGEVSSSTKDDTLAYQRAGRKCPVIHVNAQSLNRFILPY